MITKIVAVLVHFFSGEAGIIKIIQVNQMRRVAYWQLHNMTDKDLKDIGLNRSDIHQVAYGGRGRGATT
jgi:uncharacterized protein YjiS (DUF1127 family)